VYLDEDGQQDCLPSSDEKRNGRTEIGDAIVVVYNLFFSDEIALRVLRASQIQISVLSSR